MDEDTEKREAEVRRAHSAYDKAMSAVQEAGIHHPGSRGGGIEANYGQTYQHLVRLGEKPQLKLKYRRLS